MLKRRLRPSSSVSSAIAEIEADAELLRLVEQRLRLGPGHLALVVAVELGLVLDQPAREEGGERELGEDDELGAPALGLAHQRDQPPHRILAGLGLGDRPHLGRRSVDDPGHLFSPQLLPLAGRSHTIERAHRSPPSPSLSMAVQAGSVRHDHPLDLERLPRAASRRRPVRAENSRLVGMPARVRCRWDRHAAEVEHIARHGVAEREQIDAMEQLVVGLERRDFRRGDRRGRPGEQRAVHLRVELGLETLAPALDRQQSQRRHPLAVHDAADDAPVDLGRPSRRRRSR